MSLVSWTIVVTGAVTVVGLAYVLARRYLTVPVAPNHYTLLLMQGFVIVLADDEDRPQTVVKLGGRAYDFADRHSFLWREDGEKILFLPPNVGFVLRGTGWGEANKGLDLPRRWRWQIKNSASTLPQAKGVPHGTASE